MLTSHLVPPKEVLYKMRAVLSKYTSYTKFDYKHWFDEICNLMQSDLDTEYMIVGPRAYGLETGRSSLKVVCCFSKEIKHKFYRYISDSFDQQTKGKSPLALYNLRITETHKIELFCVKKPNFEQIKNSDPSFIPTRSNYTINDWTGCILEGDLEGARLRGQPDSPIQWRVKLEKARAKKRFYRDIPFTGDFNLDLPKLLAERELEVACKDYMSFRGKNFL